MQTGTLVARQDLAATATALVAAIDDHLDGNGGFGADLAAAGPYLDRLRACDPLVLARPVQSEVLRCWARTVDERIGRADVPAAVVDEDLAMLDALRSAAGRGPGPVPLLRLRWARLRGDAEAAAAAADLLRMHGTGAPRSAVPEPAPARAALDPGTPPPDRPRAGERCRACELSEYGARLADRRHPAAAARTLLAAAAAAPPGGCGAGEPARTLARALLPLLEAGRADEARAAYVAGGAVRGAAGAREGRPGTLHGDVLGLRLQFLARSGNAALGLRELAAHAAVLAREPRTDRRLTALVGAAVLLDAVRAAGHGATTVSAPDGGTAGVTELARDFRLEAQRLARVLDRRHDTDHLVAVVDEQLAAGRAGGRHRRSRRPAAGTRPAERLALGLGEPVLPAGPPPLPAPDYRHPQLRPPTREELTAALARAQELLDDRSPRAAAAWDEAEECARRGPGTAADLARAAAARGTLAAEAGDPAAAVPHLREALSLVPTLLPARAQLGAALTRTGRADEGRALLDAAVAAAAGLPGYGAAADGGEGDPDAARRTVRIRAEKAAETLDAGRVRELVRALRLRALARAGAADDALPAPVPLDSAADREEVREDLELAARLAFRRRLPAEEALVHAARANLLHAASPERAGELLADAERVWIRLGHAWQLAGAAHWIGLCAEALGRAEEAAEAQHRAEQLAVRHPQPALHRRALFARLRAIRAQGRSHEAVPVGLAATVALEEAGERAQAAQARRHLGAALLELGRLHEAAGYLAAALPDLDPDDAAARAECRLDLADAHLATGNPHAAVTHYGFASQELERAGESRKAADAAARTGDLLSGLQRSTLAVRAYLHASDLLGRGPDGDAPAAARARTAAAEVLIAAGEVASAAVALTRAWYDLSAAGEGTDRELQARIERMLGELQER